jgi:hypothetical protein
MELGNVNNEKGFEPKPYTPVMEHWHWQETTQMLMRFLTESSTSRTNLKEMEVTHNAVPVSKDTLRLAEELLCDLLKMMQRKINS